MSVPRLIANVDTGVDDAAMMVTALTHILSAG